MYRTLRTLFYRSRFRRASRRAGRRAALYLAALLCGLALFGPASSAAAGEPILVIVHTGDAHGHALEERDPDSGVLTRPGYARLKTYFHDIPAGAKMLLDAGDILPGQPLAAVSRGEFIALILKDLKYDALAVGNHDFDYGLPRLMELRDSYGLNFTAANIIEKEDGVPLLPPYLVKDYGGFKVGVFALTTPPTPQATNLGHLENLSFGTPEQVVRLARTMTEKLRREEKVEMVVALTHLGAGSQDQPGVREVARGAPGLDLIIDGHSPALATGLREGDALIVGSGAFMEHLGRVTVSRAPEGGLILTPELIPAAELETVPPDPELNSLLNRLTLELDREMGRVVARTPFNLDGRPEEIRVASTNLGRLVCAALKSATGADAAILNSGSLRGTLPAGEITRGQLLNALPFANNAVTVRLTGAEVLETLNAGLARPGEGAFPQFYGLTVTAQETGSTAPDGSPNHRYRADLVEIGGQPLDLQTEYTIAVNDFMSAGGDGYKVLAGRPAIEYAAVADIVQSFLSSAIAETFEAVNSEDVLTIIIEQ